MKSYIARAKLDWLRGFHLSPNRLFFTLLPTSAAK
jgi:hypothetical protein